MTKEQCLEDMMHSFYGWKVKQKEIPSVAKIMKKFNIYKIEHEEDYGYIFSNEEIENIAFEIHDKETQAQQVRQIAILGKTQGWLPKPEDRDTPFADSYYEYLLHEEKYPQKVVDEIFASTEKVLDRMAPTNQEGAVLKKGLVMGNVQSGKTANYMALINKAADAGYKLIILVAGVHNILRKQTQQRVDKGFLGFDSVKFHLRENNYLDPIGVGYYLDSNPALCITNHESDFPKEMGSGSIDLTKPTIIVIKKQKDILNSVMTWLRDLHNKTSKLSYPMLLIDDEADNASVNTNDAKDDNGEVIDPTAINKKLRQILYMFEKASYVGYTATPFANIFMDPNSSPIKEIKNITTGKVEYEYIDNENLFPEDFIVSLESSPEYIGPKKVFIDKTHKDMLKEITDVEKSSMDTLAVTMSKDQAITHLPDSLIDALGVWLLTIGIRKIRKNKNKHNTMLVNISHIVSIQIDVKNLLVNELNLYKQKIKDYLDDGMFEPSKEVVRLFELYSLEFKKSDENKDDFDNILKVINDSADLIKTYLVNSETKDKLNYEKYEDTGLNALAVGGYSLSRGFTLEGLSVTYLIRNSRQYDTLLQMGRWFGYRSGYADLCRLYMKKNVQGWYEFISKATEDLREQLREMEQQGKKPLDFMVKVRKSPAGLKITATNRMKNAEELVKAKGYAGNLEETKEIINDADIINDNLNLTKDFIANLPQNNLETLDDKRYFLYKDIEVSTVMDYLASYAHNPTKSRELDEQLIEDWLIEKSINYFDVVLLSKDAEQADEEIEITDTIAIAKRMRAFKFVKDDNLIRLDNTITNDLDECIGLEHLDCNANNRLSRKKARELRVKPLLLITVLELQNQKVVYELNPTAVAIIFPGKKSTAGDDEVMVNAGVQDNMRS